LVLLIMFEKSKVMKGLILNRKFIKNYESISECKNASGRLDCADPQKLSKVIHKINRQKEAEHSQTYRPGELQAIIILNSINRYIFRKFAHTLYPEFSDTFIKRLETDARGALERLARRFKDNFVPFDGIEKPIGIIEEAILLNVLSDNKAAARYCELFDGTLLEESKDYQKLLTSFELSCDSYPLPNSKEKNLIAFLKKPAKLYPDSLLHQLKYISSNWTEMLEDFLDDILKRIDLLQEEEKTRFAGPAAAQSYTFSDEEEASENFSEDKNWMPRLVMLAKSTYVWLSQLRRKYQRSIYHLDDIPEEELALLAKHGFTGLWLIGIWERSATSAKIKRLMGDHDAIASAYSLKNYRVAEALGGEAAMNRLKEKAARYNIRIACDMVPNHTGLDSDWMIDHPDWFLQLDHSPFPSYTFSKHNLSEHEDIEVYLEDKYYDRSDAAVVFKYYDHRDNRTRYIYHGNDGTHMPWNDTAQLNYLKEEVREAVIHTIVEIAKSFPIIRFDAAMTLAKKHYQRLWFPQPGSGGDIPSRSQFSMSKEEFAKLMPAEFWRQVVDRIALEAPDTLLLAEAFWMMEGYFVRTLGMHRVYNSAFMNMLKEEDNAKYRKSIYNILNYNPEILKRFVNFMSNPDEETAIEQFGVDDKYFGVCILMCTMPGLPMFAHGQIEGLKERYGMEYKEPQWDESENRPLIVRHKTEIFPLLKKRYLFAEVNDFVLYDFITASGAVNENVFVYSNNYENEAALVVYNNKYEQASGKLHIAYRYRKDDNGNLIKTSIDIAKALKLDNNPNCYAIFRDNISGLEYLKNCKDLHQSGIFLDLKAFKYFVFADIRQVYDENGQYSELAHHLSGGGIPSISKAIKRKNFKPLLRRFTALISKETTKKLLELKSAKTGMMKHFEAEMCIRIIDFLDEMEKKISFEVSKEDIYEKISHNMITWLQNDHIDLLGKRLSGKLADCKTLRILTLYWIYLHPIAEYSSSASDNILSDLLLDELIEQNIVEMKLNIESKIAPLTLSVLLQYGSLGDRIMDRPIHVIAKELFDDSNIRRIIRAHTYEDKLWFHYESLQFFLSLLTIVNLINIMQKHKPSKAKRMSGKYRIFIKQLLTAIERSDYQIPKIIEQLEKGKNNAK